MYTHIERIYNTVARNLGLREYSGHTNSWTEWAFEAELLIGSRDTFEEAEAVYSSTGAAASGTITFTANPSRDDAITLNGVTLFFRSHDVNNQSAPANTVKIKSTLALTLDELVKELSGTSSSPANAPGNVFIEILEGYTYTSDATTLTITKDEVGIDGNNYTLSSSNVNAKCSGYNLSGGKGLLFNQQLRLPDNMVKLLGVRVGADSTLSKHIELRQPTAIHKNRIGRDSNETQQKAFSYYVSGNRLNIQHDTITDIVVVYSSYPVDGKGYPMVNDSHATAITQYIMWQHKNIEYINGKLSQYVIKDLEKRWYFLCGKTRGDDNMPTAEELKQIGKIWNTMIPLKNSRGLIDL